MGSDNGLVPVRQQVLSWTDDGLAYWYACATWPQCVQALNWFVSLIPVGKLILVFHFRNKILKYIIINTCIKSLHWYIGLMKSTLVKLMALYNTLINWGQDKMAANFLITFSNAFSWMKIYEFRLRFHLSLFPRVQLTIFQHWLR